MSKAISYSLKTNKRLVDVITQFLKFAFAYVLKLFAC
jgi:hypothetical protein